MSQDLHNPHDSLFKAVWSRPEVARSFVRHYLPAEVVATLRLDTLELVRDAFVDERLKAHYSELLYRLQGRDGCLTHIHVLLEHKSIPERDTAFQLLRYTLRI